MIKKNKIIIVLIGIFMAICISIGIALILLNNSNNNTKEEVTKTSTLSEEDLENNFRNLFYNINYEEEENNIVTKWYNYEENKEDEYSIKLNIPKINLETEIASQINDEILHTYGNKLLDIIDNNREYTIYNVDFITFTNDNIISIILKSVLKEGNNPQRAIVQTYNYDLENDRLLTFDELLKVKNIDKLEVQSKIIDIVREKNNNTAVLAEQGYNIYVRDIRSNEYLIQNITTFFIGEEGHIFIVFPYGNKNFTETMDIIIF